MHSQIYIYIYISFVQAIQSKLMTLTSECRVFLQHTRESSAKKVPQPSRRECIGRNPRQKGIATCQRRACTNHKMFKASNTQSAPAGTTCSEQPQKSDSAARSVWPASSSQQLVKSLDISRCQRSEVGRKSLLGLLGDVIFVRIGRQTICAQPTRQAECTRSARGEACGPSLKT